jgi:hypothetical protein
MPQILPPKPINSKKRKALFNGTDGVSTPKELLSLKKLLMIIFAIL